MSDGGTLSTPAGGVQLLPCVPVSQSAAIPVRQLDTSRRAADAAMARGEPFIVRGIQDGSVALSRWSFADIAARHGDRVVPVMTLTEGMLDYGSSTGIAYVERRVREVIAELGEPGTPRWYIATPAEAHFPGLLAEAHRPIYAESASFQASRFWLGSGGTITPLHHELTDNVLCMIDGEKELVLLPPDARRAVRPHPPWSGTPHLARLDPRERRLDAALAATRVLRCTIRRGDSIVIPRMWWHAVRTTTDSIAVNYWWARGLRAAIPQAAVLYKRVFGIST